MSTLISLRKHSKQVTGWFRREFMFKVCIVFSFHSLHSYKWHPIILKPLQTSYLHRKRYLYFEIQHGPLVAFYPLLIPSWVRPIGDFISEKKTRMRSHDEKDRFCLMPTEIEIVDRSTLFVCLSLLILFLFLFLFSFLCLFLIAIFAKSLIDSVTNLIWM